MSGAVETALFFPDQKWVKMCIEAITGVFHYQQVVESCMGMTIVGGILIDKLFLKLTLTEWELCIMGNVAKNICRILSSLLK